VLHSIRKVQLLRKREDFDSLIADLWKESGESTALNRSSGAPLVDAGGGWKPHRIPTVDRGSIHNKRGLLSC
jgi:hypothetical protein